MIYIGCNTGVGPDFRSVNLRLNKSFRLRRDGSLREEFDATQNKFVAVPIDLGPETDQVF